MIFHYLFILILILLLLLTYNSRKQGLLSPSILFLSSAIVCNIMVLLFYGKWELSINISTYVVYLTGVLCFLISGLLFSYIANKTFRIKRLNRKRTNRGGTLAGNELILSYNKLVIDLFIIVSVYGAYTSYKFLFSTTGAGNLTRAMFLFRNAGATGGIGRTFISSQIYRINYATLLVFLFVNVYNFPKKKKIDPRIIIYLLTSIVHIWLFTCGRQDILEIFVFIVLAAFIVSQKKRSHNIKKIAKIAVIGLAIIPLFYYSSKIVGRNFDAISQLSPIEYFAKYLGGGFVFLDHIISDGIKTQYWGQSSFSNVYARLISKGYISNNINIMSAHSFYTYGNTVTIFGRWYEDFGILGVCIMSFIVSGIFTYIYYKAIKKNTADNILLKIVYCRFASGIVWFGYDDRFCSMVSFPYFVILIYIILSFKFLVKENQFLLGRCNTNDE